MKPSAGYQVFGRRFKSSAESSRCAGGYLKLRYPTGCSNQPRYFTAFSLLPIEVIETGLFLFLNMFFYGFWTWWISWIASFSKSFVYTLSSIWLKRNDSSAFNNRTFSFDLRLFLFFKNWMKLQKGLLPPIISFYTMARCLFMFLNIVDINAIGSFFKSEFNNFCSV